MGETGFDLISHLSAQHVGQDQVQRLLTGGVGSAV
jgi:hypothetical protein